MLYKLWTPVINRLTQHLLIKIYDQLHVSAMLSHRQAA